MVLGTRTARILFSWLVGFVAFLILVIISTKVLETLSIRTEYFDSYDQQKSLTWIGWFLYAVCLYIAIRVGLASFFLSLNKGFEPNQNLGWLLCLAFFGLFSTSTQWFAFSFGDALDAYVDPFFGLIGMYAYGGLLAYFCHISFKNLKDGEQSPSFKRIAGADGNHWLEKKDGVYFFYYDNHKDLMTWTFKSKRRVADNEVIKWFEFYAMPPQEFHLFFQWLKKKKFDVQGPF